MCMYNVSGYYQVPWERERDTEKFSVMGTLFNPDVREARGSLYKLHTSEIEYTSFPRIAALIGGEKPLSV